MAGKLDDGLDRHPLEEGQFNRWGDVRHLPIILLFLPAFRPITTLPGQRIRERTTTSEATFGLNDAATKGFKEWSEALGTFWLTLDQPLDLLDSRGGFHRTGAITPGCH